MLSRTLRMVLICVVVFSIMVIPAAGSPLMPAAALPDASSVQARRAQSSSDLLALLAAATGREASRLESGDIAPVTLLDGRQLVRVKAIDRVTGEVVGATFEDRHVVDEQALRAKVAAEWRAAHGALTPDLVNKFQRMLPQETLDVGIWLKATVEPLPKPEHIYVPQHDESTGGDADLGGRVVSIPKDQNAARPVLPEGRKASADLSSGDPGAFTEAEKSIEAGVGVAKSSAETRAALAQVEALKAQNDATIRAQIAPVRRRFLDILRARGLEAQVQYASENAPVVFLSSMTRLEVEDLARLPEVDAIYDARKVGGPALANARPTQNADLLESVGYTGDGVNVSVTEGERMTTTNPYLPVVAVRDATRSFAPHPTAVGGIIRSIHSTIRGLAPGVNLYNANGDDYTTAAALSAAMDWGRDNASVLNHSFWIEDEGTTDAPFLFDRHLDYIVRYNFDVAMVAAGNFGQADCEYGGSLARDYVATPGKGYNALTVGNYDDANTLGWSDDVMDSCSSYNHTGRWKPEVAAVGNTISSTTTAAPWIGPVGSGTSYASPMVTALAADLVQITSTLAVEPEAQRAIIMATALHNVEGDARLSRQDGAGGIDASAAAVTAERGWWDDRLIGSGTTFPITFTVFARQGERVRFVTNWLSNPAADYSTDPQPVDLDLRAYRQDGTTLLSSSIDGLTNFEIVDFIAPAAENYQIVVSFSGGSWSGNTYLGSAWWRSPNRILPDVGYLDPKAPPMGTHLEVSSTVGSPSNYWRAIGIRSPAGTDHDLSLYTASWFDDPATRTLLKTSAYGSGYVDFIAVDGNHWPASNPEDYRVSYFGGGTDGYNVSRSSLGVGLAAPGRYGPYNMSSAEVVKVFDVYFRAKQSRRISIVPTVGNATNLGLGLYQSSSGNSSSWVKRRSESVKFSDVYTTTSGIEQVTFTNGTTSDWLGLVVFSNDSATGQFYVVVEDFVYLPAIMKN